MNHKVFKESSVKRLSSPEKLNDFIQVSSVSTWLVLGAALSLILGLLAWGFFGEITQQATFSGVAKDGQLSCYVTTGVRASLDAGMEVDITPLTAEEDVETVKGNVVSCSDTPLSYDEVAAGIESDYLKSALGISGWNMHVTVAPEKELQEGFVYMVHAVTETFRPIDMLFR